MINLAERGCVTSISNLETTATTYAEACTMLPAVPATIPSTLFLTGGAQRDLENCRNSERTYHTTETETIDWYPKTELPQDGGLAGWTCVLGSFFALFCTFGWLNSYVSLSCQNSEQSFESRN